MTGSQALDAAAGVLGSPQTHVCPSAHTHVHVQTYMHALHMVPRGEKCVLLI